MTWSPASASEKSPATQSGPRSTPAYTVGKNSKRLADKAQRVADEQQRQWDKKMKAISGSICTGC